MIELWFLLALSYAILHGMTNFLDRFFLKYKNVETMSFSTLRFVINSIISFLFIAIISGIYFPANPNFWIYLLLIVVVYTVAALIYFHMIKIGDISKTIPIGQSMNTLLAFLLAIVLLSEKTTLHDFLGTIFIMLGGYIILTDGKIKIPKISKEIVLAIGWGLLLAIFGVISKPATNFAQPLVLNTFLYSSVAFNFVIISSLFKSTDMKKTVRFFGKNKKLLGILILSSFFATTGTLFLFFALSFRNAAEVLPISRSLPLFTALFGWLFLKEKHGVVRILGAAIIVLGIYLIFI